jgi:hypothetical protein
MKVLHLLLIIATSVNVSVCNNDMKQDKKIKIQALEKKNVQTLGMTKIRLVVGQKATTAIMYDNSTSKEFISLLPLTLSLTDYANEEKISNLPKKLTTKDAPVGYKPLAGELSIYAPWGNLALFYKNGAYAKGLIPLGKIDGDIDIFKGHAPIQVTFEKIK